MVWDMYGKKNSRHDVFINTHVKLWHTVSRTGTTIVLFLVCWKTIVITKRLLREFMSLRLLACYFIVSKYLSSRYSRGKKKLDITEFSREKKRETMNFNLKKEKNCLDNYRVRVNVREIKLRISLFNWEICTTMFQADYSISRLLNYNMSYTCYIRERDRFFTMCSSDEHEKSVCRWLRHS